MACHTTTRIYSSCKPTNDHVSIFFKIVFFGGVVQDDELFMCEYMKEGALETKCSDVRYFVPSAGGLKIPTFEGIE